mmetsp:Transcript_78430/g.209563  ORF Transcript_78430/g.209563 Transcript_78430/m.209563 type:complete len:211 (-) Transcript_78430:81-713(-)
MIVVLVHNLCEISEIDEPITIAIKIGEHELKPRVRRNGNIVLQLVQYDRKGRLVLNRIDTAAVVCVHETKRSDTQLANLCFHCAPLRSSLNSSQRHHAILSGECFRCSLALCSFGQSRRLPKPCTRLMMLNILLNNIHYVVKIDKAITILVIVAERSAVPILLGNRSDIPRRSAQCRTDAGCCRTQINASRIAAGPTNRVGDGGLQRHRR